MHTNVTKFLEGFRYDAHPMGMLLGAVGALSTFYPDAKDIDDPANRYLQRVRLMAKMPTIAAFVFRHARGLPYVFPRNDLDYVGNFVNMTFESAAAEPNPVLQRALEILLILHADHEQNCSTNAVRGVGSSHVDPFSAISAGIAALYGPLHGGANEAVLQMLDEIGDVKNVPAFIEQVKGGGGRLMGFGHRVYKSYDPRAKLIKQVADEVFAADRPQPEARDRARARADRARGRVLHLAQALSQRRLLLGPHLPGDGLPDRLLHGALRPRPAAGLDRAVGGDARRPRAEDLTAAADVHRSRSARLRADRSALNEAQSAAFFAVQRRRRNATSPPTMATTPITPAISARRRCSLGGLAAGRIVNGIVQSTLPPSS